MTRNDFVRVGRWQSTKEVGATTWTCGYCGDKVSSEAGYVAGEQHDGSGPTMATIRICPSCKGPTVFASDQRMPGTLPGREISNVSPELSELYNEARSCSSVGAFTAAAMACRKMLMNIAVSEGAEVGQSFLDYVGYLADRGYVPPNGEVWVDYIRRKGNEANHEISLMKEEDAIALITFVEMLLAFIYELPSLVPAIADDAKSPKPIAGGELTEE